MSDSLFSTIYAFVGALLFFLGVYFCYALGLKPLNDELIERGYKHYCPTSGDLIWKEEE